MKKSENEVTKGKQGRPVNLNSARQMRLAAMEAKKAANGGVLVKGRPVNGQSARQIKLAERAAIIAAGGVIKRGRPAMTKAEEVAKPAKVKKAKKAKVAEVTTPVVE